MASSSNTLHWSNADAEVHKVVVGSYDNNVFVIKCRQTGESLLIDAANEHELLLELCQRLNVRRVLETHGHFDHIGAVPQIREAGYEVGVTALDAPMLKDVGYDVFIDDAEVIEVGRLRLHAIHLAAADRLPRPVGFITFDPQQIPVALGLGFDVVSS
jgi:glyoxylase-like metal-dependent hydrolase (beta-lactamase superfamily II)